MPSRPRCCSGPRTCGTHTVFVVAGLGGTGSASGSTTVQVGSCSVSALTGSATRVGDGADNAQVRIAGRMVLSAASGTPDLARARVTLLSLLAETAGVGELVDRIAAGPVRLVARSGGKPTSAIFESQPGSARPSFRMEVKQRSAGLLEFALQVDRAVLSSDPEHCSAGKPSTTVLTTSFVIDDGQRAPVMATTSLPWSAWGRIPRRAPSRG